MLGIQRGPHWFCVVSRGWRLPGDWYPGTIPDNVIVDPTARIGSSHNFARFRSVLPVAGIIGRGASLDAILDVGPEGKITIGCYAMVTTPYILCDREIEIGNYSMISWNAVLMDSYRYCEHSHQRSGPSEDFTASFTAPVRLGPHTWIGFEACILPGVTIGEGSIVGARSVVTHDVPPFVVVAGNPARVIRELHQPRDGFPAYHEQSG